MDLLLNNNTNFTVTENYSQPEFHGQLSNIHTGTPSQYVDRRCAGLSGSSAFSMDGAYIPEGDVTSYADLNSAIEYTSTSATFTLASPDVGLAGNAAFSIEGSYSPTGSITDTNTAMEYTSENPTITLHTGYSGLAGNEAFSMEGTYTPSGSVTSYVDLNSAILYTMSDFRLQTGHTELGGNDNFSINYTPQGSITSFADVNTAILYTFTDGSETIQLATGHTLWQVVIFQTNFSITHIPVGSPTITTSVVDSNNVTVNTMIIESDHVFSNLNTDYTLYTVPTQTDYSTLSGVPMVTITLRDPSDYTSVVLDITVSSDQGVTPLPDIQENNVFTSVPPIESLRGDVTNCEFNRSKR